MAHPTTIAKAHAEIDKRNEETSRRVQTMRLKARESHISGYQKVLDVINHELDVILRGQKDNPSKTLNPDTANRVIRYAGVFSGSDNIVADPSPPATLIQLNTGLADVPNEKFNALIGMAHGTKEES
jgi:hypothetical protein